MASAQPKSRRSRRAKPPLPPVEIAQHHGRKEQHVGHGERGQAQQHAGGEPARPTALADYEQQHEQVEATGQQGWQQFAAKVDEGTVQCRGNPRAESNPRAKDPIPQQADENADECADDGLDESRQVEVISGEGKEDAKQHGVERRLPKGRGPTRKGDFAEVARFLGIGAGIDDGRGKKRAGAYFVEVVQAR